MLMLQWSLVHAGEDETKLSREQKIALLQRLRGATKQMHAQFLLQPAQVRAVPFVRKACACNTGASNWLGWTTVLSAVHTFVLIRLPTGMSFC